MRPGADARLRQVPVPDLWPDIERRIQGRRPQPVRSALRYAGPVAASLAVLALFAWALVSLNDGFRGDGPAAVALTDPNGAAIAGLHADVRIVPDEKVGDVLARDGVSYASGFGPIPGGSSVVVRLDWTPQPSAPPGSSYVIVVLDKTGPQEPGPLWTSEPVTMGWDGRLDEVATRYQWLTPAVDVCDDTGCHDVTTAAFVRPQDSGPLWIVARFPDRGPNGLRAGSEPDPLVGVIFADADVDPVWAARVYG
jgi:hypothetical protein